jgi:integrase/recombinase XerD
VVHNGLTPNTPGPLLRSVDRDTGTLRCQRLTVDGIAKALAARVRAAGLTPATPHDLRRSYITDLLNQDVDVLTVAGLAGHARIDTTRKYDRRPHATRVAAVATLGDD